MVTNNCTKLTSLDMLMCCLKGEYCNNYKMFKCCCIVVFPLVRLEFALKFVLALL